MTMILDKLMEKKDIVAWITYRIQELAMDKKKALKESKPKERENINRMFIGRYRELCHLKSIIKDGGAVLLKDDSKRMFEKVNHYKDEVKDNARCRLSGKKEFG